jgi:predicted ATPase
MYLTSLRLQNIRLLADQAFSFTRPNGEPRLWTVILGDNGLCKSTLLQSVALAASGLKLTSALVGDAQTFRRVDATQEQDARIEARFEWNRRAGREIHRVTLRAGLEVRPNRHDFTLPKGPAGIGTRHFDELRGLREPGAFVVGYGVGRFLPRPGEVALPTDPVVDRVEGLFDKRHKMLGTDFYGAIERQEAGRARAFLRQLRDVLLAEYQGERLFPLLSNVELRGKAGVDALRKLLESHRFVMGIEGKALKLPATALSDGYQSMLAWIADLLGHAFLEDTAKTPDVRTLRGIVLLDEIDLHLHPTWQRRLVPVLKQVFPQLQFIVTTHSPLVLAGFEQEEIIRLAFKNGRVVQDEAPMQPGLLTATQLLSSFFNVPTASRPDLVQKKRRYLELRGRSRHTPRQARELKALEAELAPYWVSPLGGRE